MRTPPPQTTNVRFSVAVGGLRPNITGDHYFARGGVVCSPMCSLLARWPQHCLARPIPSDYRFFYNPSMHQPFSGDLSGKYADVRFMPCFMLGHACPSACGGMCFGMPRHMRRHVDANAYCMHAQTITLARIGICPGRRRHMPRHEVCGWCWEV